MQIKIKLKNQLLEKMESVKVADLAYAINK